MSAHQSGYVGWHKDTTSIEKEGHRFHLEPGALFVQVGIYLQDNGPRGGGLEVMPGSHRWRTDPFVARSSSAIARFVNDQVLDRWRARRAYAIPSRAGDAVIFNLRLNHRATRPPFPPEQLEEHERKLAVFLVCAGDYERALQYRAAIAARSGYEYLEGHEYPQAVRDIAEENRLVLA
jgi:hypothetical protein